MANCIVKEGMIEIVGLTITEAHQIKRALRMGALKHQWTEREEKEFCDHMTREISHAQSHCIKDKRLVL